MNGMRTQMDGKGKEGSSLIEWDSIIQAMKRSMLCKLEESLMDKQRRYMKSSRGSSNRIMSHVVGDLHKEDALCKQALAKISTTNYNCCKEALNALMLELQEM